MTNSVTFSAVTSPVYSKPDNSAVDCIVTVSEDSDHPYAGQEHPFTCVANDPMPYGAALWVALQAGTYGAIGAYVAPTLTPQQNADNAIAAGIIVTSTETPSLSGTYPIDPATQVKLNSAITYIILNGAFPPASAVSMPWYDADGVAHVFTAIVDFKNFATAFADFVAHVDIYAGSDGETGSIPSNNITIP